MAYSQGTGYIPTPSAFVPGQASVTTYVREAMSLPKYLLLVAAVLAVREMMKPASAKLAAQSAGTCQAKYCSEIFTDAPKHTLLTDQSMGAGLGTTVMTTLAQIKQRQQTEFAKEQMQSPGVRLVAGRV